MYAAGLKYTPHFHKETDEITKQNKLDMKPPMKRQVIGRVLPSPKALIGMANPIKEGAMMLPKKF